MNGIWANIEQQLSHSTNKSVKFIHTESLSGGCINKTFKMIDTNNTSWFIKMNTASLVDMFAAEATGLEELRKSASIRIPNSFCYGSNDEFSYLVLEYIALSPSINAVKTGQQLAQMHQSTSSKFGWHLDNTLGSTSQSNRHHENWLSFWKKERLLFQLELAKNKGYTVRNYDLGIQLAGKLEAFFTDYQPKASLLHGDLWSGNCGSDENNTPVIYDPAVYYGDRETDIAMTELFGGFSDDFYQAYHESYPLDAGYKTRKDLYNLYHVLNHYNLFGGSYESQASSITRKLLAEA